MIKYCVESFINNERSVKWFAENEKENARNYALQKYDNMSIGDIVVLAYADFLDNGKPRSGVLSVVDTWEK